MSIATVITRGFAIGDIAGVATRGFLGSGTVPAVVDTTDTHDPGGPFKRKPWNKQPMPTLAQLRKLLGLDKRATPAEIAAQAEAIEDAAEAIEGDAPPPAEWAPPKPIEIVALSPEIPRMLALASRDLVAVRESLDRAVNAARRAALERYEQSLVDLAAAIKARLDEDEEDEIVSLIASGLIH